MANCSNCSAPLPSGSITCEYCGSRNDIDLKGIHFNTTNEPESERVCPRCAKRLQTIDLQVQGKFLIERCDQCLGLFFDPGELEALLQSSVTNVFAIDRSRLAAINSTKRAEDFGVAYIKCPVCATVMNRVNFGVRSGVIIDRCREHGVWLDGGELRHLAEWMKAGGKLLDQERQEERRKNEAEVERSRQKERETALTGSGYGGYGSGYDDFSVGGTADLDDLFSLLKKAVGLFTR